MQRRFYESCKEAGDKMPVYVAVECPDACKLLVSRGGFRERTRGEGVLIWVVCYEAKGYISTRIDLDDVATYGGGWGVNRCSTVDTGAGGGPLYDLEIVAV